MTGPAYHGWTHRPKSEGGTDPIPIAAASDLSWALAGASQVAVADAGAFYSFTFDSLYSNSTTDFESANVTTGRAAWIQINTPGYYEMQASILKPTAFDNTFHQWIEPTFESGGSVAAIQPNQGVADYIGMFQTQGFEVLVGETAHTGLYTNLTFNWNPDDPNSDMDFENPLKVGLDLALGGGPGTITMGGLIYLKRIAAAGYTDLSPA